MPRIRAANLRAFTLVETIATIVVISVISAVLSGVILNCTQAYSAACAQREAAERVSLALDRVIRLVREIPEVADTPGVPDITTAGSDRLIAGDGSAITLTNGTLELTLPGEDPAPLCRSVTTFELTYLGADGVPLNFAAGETAAQTHRVLIRLVTPGSELRTGVFLRTVLAAS